MNKRSAQVRRYVLVFLVIVAAIVILTVDVPNVEDFRRFAQDTGAWFPLLFFALYVVLTQFPIPRTVFTLSSGILFGPIIGIGVAILATGVAAAMSLIVVRYLGRDWYRQYLRNPLLVKLDFRLEQRGWLAVLSMRMIAGIPFSILNYACALSSIRFWPFLIATIAGSAPGTIAVVLLGDALIDGLDYRLIVIAGVLAVLGVCGLFLDARMPIVDRVKLRG